MSTRTRFLRYSVASATRLAKRNTQLANLTSRRGIWVEANLDVRIRRCLRGDPSRRTRVWGGGVPRCDRLAFGGSRIPVLDRDPSGQRNRVAADPSMSYVSSSCTRITSTPALGSVNGSIASEGSTAMSVADTCSRRVSIASDWDFKHWGLGDVLRVAVRRVDRRHPVDIDLLRGGDVHAACGTRCCRACFRRSSSRSSARSCRNRRCGSPAGRPVSAPVDSRPVPAALRRLHHRHDRDRRMRLRPARSSRHRRCRPVSPKSDGCRGWRSSRRSALFKRGRVRRVTTTWSAARSGASLVRSRSLQ